MLDDEGVKQKPEIVLEDNKTDYEIKGLREGYIRYCDEVMEAAPPYCIITWPMKALGGLLFVIGLLVIIFGPRYVTYNVLSGPSFSEFFQLYPGPIATAGSFIYGAGAWIDSTGYEKLISPEDFLGLKYDLVVPKGSKPIGDILIQHVDGDTYQIIRVESPAINNAEAF